MHQYFVKWILCCISYFYIFQSEAVILTHFRIGIILLNCTKLNQTVQASQLHWIEISFPHSCKHRNVEHSKTKHFTLSHPASWSENVHWIEKCITLYCYVQRSINECRLSVDLIITQQAVLLVSFEGGKHYFRSSSNWRLTRRNLLRDKL